MIDLFSEYLSFMNRPFDETTATGVQTVPEFYTTLLLLTAGFSLLYKIVPLLLDTFASKWYNGLDPVKRKELPTYLISFAHHFVVVPLGWFHIYEDYTMWRSNIQPPTNYYALKETPLIAFGCAFLLADIINCALADALDGKPLYLCHHILVTTFGVSAARSVPGSFMRLNPHFLICETTNIFFNTAWVLRATGWRGNPVVLAFEYLFALSFFPLRILNLTVVIWALQTKGASLGFAKYTLHPIGAMQYFWCYKILSMIHTRYSSPVKEISSIKETSEVESEEKIKKCE